MVRGHDVRHAEFGHGWVQGSGLGRVTVRFETPYSEPGRVRTFRTDDPRLEPADPLPLVERRPEEPGRTPADVEPGASGAGVPEADPTAPVVSSPGGQVPSGSVDQVSSDPASRPKSRSGGGGGAATSSP